MKSTKNDENLISEYIIDEDLEGEEEVEDGEYYDEDDDENDEDEYVEEVPVKDVRNEEDLIIQDIADFLKIFGDYSRIKILESIMDISYTVGDLAVFTGLTHSAVSHHLKILRQAKMVVGVRDGKYVYYRVADKHISEIYDLTRTHIEEFKKTISAYDEDNEMAERYFRKVFGDE